MLTRWIIRFVAIISVLLMGVFADAQTQGGKAGSSPGGGGTGSGSSAPGGARGGTGKTGGTVQKPAPKPPANSPPVGAPGGGQTGAGTGTTGNTGTAGVITGTGTPITGTGTPITQTPPTGNPNPTGTIRPPEDRRDGVQGERRRHRHRDPNDPNRFRNAPVYILPQTYSWAPYTWWFNGSSSDWFPPVWDDGYDGDGYAGRDDDRYDRVAPPTPNVPTTPSPAQVQAQSTNALQGSTTYSHALVEFKTAQQAYEDASGRVLAKLRKDPEYQRLLAERDRAGEKVEAVQAGARIPPSVEQVAPAAQQKLNVSSKITKMEQDAIAADPEASAAKARMIEANARVSALRKQAEAGGGRSQ